MRILVHCDGFLMSRIGGGEIFSYHLLKELCARGHDVLVTTPRTADERPGYGEYDGLPLFRLDLGTSLKERDIGAMRRAADDIARLVADFRPDLLHINDAMPSSFFFIRGGATGQMPRVLTLHSPMRPAGKNSVQARLMADADRIVTVSHALFRDAVRAAPEMQTKIVVIPNALPMPATQPDPLPFSPPSLLYIGRLVVEKGVDVALGAIAIMQRQGRRVSLSIAGNGPEKNRLEHLARERGVEDIVHFLDRVHPCAIPALINTATAVLVPSRWPEPFGLVALQAMQMGRPVVAARVGGLVEIVEHERTGLLVPPEDENALARGITELLAVPEKAAAMARESRQRATNAFDFGRFVTAYEAAFDACAANRAGQPMFTRAVER